MAAIDKMLWCEEEGVWLDYDLTTGSQRNRVSLSNLWPLWARAFEDQHKIPKVVQYIKRLVLENQGNHNGCDTKQSNFLRENKATVISYGKTTSTVYFLQTRT